MTRASASLYSSNLIPIVTVVVGRVKVEICKVEIRSCWRKSIREKWIASNWRDLQSLDARLNTSQPLFGLLFRESLAGEKARIIKISRPNPPRPLPFPLNAKL